MLRDKSGLISLMILLSQRVVSRLPQQHHSLALKLFGHLLSVSQD